MIYYCAIILQFKSSTFQIFAFGGSEFLHQLELRSLVPKLSFVSINYFPPHLLKKTTGSFLSSFTLSSPQFSAGGQSPPGASPLPNAELIRLAE